MTTTSTIIPAITLEQFLRDEISSIRSAAFRARRSVRSHSGCAAALARSLADLADEVGADHVDPLATIKARLASPDPHRIPPD